MPDPPTFTSAEWDVLVRLPAQVVMAVTSAQPDSPHRCVAEGLAGIDAIAAGRDSKNLLVRSVVGTIYAELVEDAATAQELSDRGLACVFTSCRRAAMVLADRCTASDSEAYRRWLESIAERVCRAARSDLVLPADSGSADGGSVDGVAADGVPVRVDERQFLANLSSALRG